MLSSSSKDEGRRGQNVMECDSEKHAIFILEIKKSKYKNPESRPIGNFISLFPPSFSSNSFIAFLKTIEIKLKYWLWPDLIHELFSNYEIQYSVTDITVWTTYIPTNLAWLCCNRKYHLALYSLIGKKLSCFFQQASRLSSFIFSFRFEFTTYLGSSNNLQRYFFSAL